MESFSAPSALIVSPHRKLVVLEPSWGHSPSYLPTWLRVSEALGVASRLYLGPKRLWTEVVLARASFSIVGHGMGMMTWLGHLALPRWCPTCLGTIQSSCAWAADVG